MEAGLKMGVVVTTDTHPSFCDGLVPALTTLLIHYVAAAAAAAAFGAGLDPPEPPAFFPMESDVLLLSVCQCDQPLGLVITSSKCEYWTLFLR